MASSCPASSSAAAAAPLLASSSAASSRLNVVLSPSVCRMSPNPWRFTTGLPGEARKLEPDDLGEDLAHDLVGAAADGAEAGVSGGALEVVLDHVAGAAVHLQAVVDQVEG